MAIVQSLRPRQWVKNIFVFAGVIFSNNLFYIPFLLRSLYTFGIFCAVASGVYLFNDIIDLPRDRIHPIKRNRPIASGRLPVWFAAVLSGILWLAGSYLAFLITIDLGVLVISYILLHILYTLVLKKVVIWDIIVVSIGFVMRAMAGALAIGVVISSWLLVCTSLLALFLITAKRRSELVLWGDNSGQRRVLVDYNISFLDNLMVVLVASTFTAYTLYVFSPATIEHFGGRALGLSIPFVFYGLFRYLLLIMRDDTGESPEKILLTDSPMIINFVVWVAVVVVVIYAGGKL